MRAVVMEAADTEKEVLIGCPAAAAPAPRQPSLGLVVGLVASLCLAAGGFAWASSARGVRGAGSAPAAGVSLVEGSGCNAPLLDFYMYRAQTDEDYSPVNQDMANVGGMLWYLHNEIIWHHYIRVGSFASTPKTRIEQWRVQMRPTCELWKRGMAFGVVNTYDLGKCSGPFKCENLAHYGPTVGCETWTKGKDNHFPHEQWYGQVRYPNAAWYSLPGECPSQKFWGKGRKCAKEEPSGACPKGKTPTGEVDCTYSYEKVGELSIDELEDIASFDDLMKKGGYEYSRSTDEGKMMSFWDHKNSTSANQRRIDTALWKFQKKYPENPHLPDPECDFDPKVFYPNWPDGDF
ncbi:unnamed protein product [Effrenium voratum]|nr:unnamed protein product [Effrenium voratum]